MISQYQNIISNFLIKFSKRTIYLVMFTLFLYSFIQPIKAQNVTIFGIIKDKTTGEALTGAVIATKNIEYGTATNNYGFYSLTLPEAKYTFTVSFLGYHPITKEIDIQKNEKTDFELIPLNLHIKEVIIKAEKNNRNISDVEISKQTLEISDIKSIPTLAGESDVFKTLQFLPGIQTTNEGTTNLSIRGGSYDQNLILLDEAPVYNASHALGFFSTFNPDAIKDITVYKSVFPPQYGGRLSSVVDIRMKEGNNKKITISGGIGLIASRLTIEVPLIADKASFIVSGRYSYAGTIANLAAPIYDITHMPSLKDFHTSNDIHFYDLNAKINFKIDEKNHLYLSAYTGKDYFYVQNIDAQNVIQWGNTTATLRWNHIFGSKLFSNTAFVFSNYNYEYTLNEIADNYLWQSNLKEYSIKTDFNWYLNANNTINFGISCNYHYFTPSKVSPIDSTSSIKNLSLGNKKALESAIFINNEQKLTDKISISYGVRITNFSTFGKEIVYKYSNKFAIVTDSILYKNGELVNSYFNIEPRLSCRILIDDNNSIKLAYTRNVQYLQLIGNTTVGLPTDVWLPADTYIKPEKADQYSLGYFKNFSNNMYESSIEVYFKNMTNVIDYKDNADLFVNDKIETQLLSGKSIAYGIEFYLKKNSGKFTGWISYTLSKIYKQIDGINNNEPFPTRYDKRHNLALVGAYKLTKNWNLNANFVFTSGGYITIPDGLYYFNGRIFNYYSNRNGYELPPYNRLDISATYSNTKNTKRKLKTEWSFGFYNVYNRKNIFSLYEKYDPYNSVDVQMNKMYLFGIVPFINLNFKF